MGELMTGAVRILIEQQQNASDASKIEAEIAALQRKLKKLSATSDVGPVRSNKSECTSVKRLITRRKNNLSDIKKMSESEDFYRLNDIPPDEPESSSHETPEVDRVVDRVVTDLRRVEYNIQKHSAFVKDRLSNNGSDPNDSEYQLDFEFFKQMSSVLRKSIEQLETLSSHE